MNERRGGSYLNLYNPATLGAERLLREFIDRKGLLERILDIIRQNTADKPQQHLIVIGSRGMGKTMLLCAIRHRVKGDALLGAEWLPVSFHEEQYGIGDLADFWLEAIRHLEAALRHSPQAADELLDHPNDDLAACAEARFFELLAASGKRALLLVDNLNDIFAAVHDEASLHRLRALLMDDARLMLIGTAASYFAEITEIGQPFHDFFRTFLLERFNQTELETVLRALAAANHDPAVPEILEKAPERVRALRILTGGNPRLAKLGYRILREGLDGDVRRDLERLLDECTPFFKHRIEGLAKEGRRVFDAIARRWDPVTVDELRKELRKPSNNISAQIKRLVDEGFIEEASGTEKKKRYQVAERFYNIYYLMRYSRDGRARLRWLVAFMKVFYTSEDYQDWAERLERELKNTVSHLDRQEKLAHLHTLLVAADEPGDRTLAFEVCVRHAIAADDRGHFAEALPADPIERFGWRYPVAELLWLLDRETRRELDFKPRESGWLSRVNQQLRKAGLLAAAGSRVSELGGFQCDTIDHARVAGFLLSEIFGRLAEAEAAFREVLKFAPHDIVAWGHLIFLFDSQNCHVEAEAACRQFLAFDPKNIYVWKKLGLTLADQRRYEEAEAAFRQAIAIEDNNPLVWLALSSVLAFQHRYPETETAIRQALDLDGEDVLGWAALSALLADQHRYAEVEAVFGKIIQLYCQASPLEQERLHEIVLEHAIVLASLAPLRTQLLEILLTLDKGVQASFEPLILALKALQDRTVLYQIAREKRDFILDIMARINKRDARRY
ncbi:MAG: tetratricopeptide repeat protein [Candidatus Competibacteraceae bacterium]|nr:tetratricopeptide repeat protein [Candidatus Competibacteraceae bacterium]MBK7985225.1 tetratricopeptide repeat protein [Candidatus Competibacteraceae bacterium]MBK8895699.1 tetratricopeptide repeat protein [Candidatus Competibacteraceae bacterium]MBK8962791.1 tetratricopeptide repeat protein [Candidatus Competibacteraceae bacterium]MBK9953277.1 tetratricopeptide repeat protein [Candidatus Competibacteraceae bacterium]